MSAAEPINYHYERLPGQGENAADIVLGFVPPQSRVLELGAGPGSITGRLSAERQCRVTAVELEASFLPHLAQRCERVVQANLNDAEWPQRLGDAGLFDRIVMADVLEHLDRPVDVLRACAPLLASGGSVVVSLPHIGHATIHACLMDEDFEYRDAGLLDRTHIRFFGLRNMQSLVEDAGLKIAEVGFVCRRPEDTEYARRWERAPDRLKAAVLENPHALVYQCVMRACRVDAPGPALNLMAIGAHAPTVTWQMRINRALKRWLPARLYAAVRRAYSGTARQ